MPANRTILPTFAAVAAIALVGTSAAEAGSMCKGFGGFSGGFGGYSKAYSAPKPTVTRTVSAPPKVQPRQAYSKTASSKTEAASRRAGQDRLCPDPHLGCQRHQGGLLDHRDQHDESQPERGDHVHHGNGLPDQRVS